MNVKVNHRHLEIGSLRMVTKYFVIAVFLIFSIIMKLTII